MKVLVIGSGGREHALGWKLSGSPKVHKVYVAPGNAGTARDTRLSNVDITDIRSLADFARTERVALTVVGPEAALCAGVVDEFRSRGLRIIGPTQAAAQLEGSKAYAKDFMQRYGIPTAQFATFSDAAPAHAHVEQHGAPVVVKADGLAAGKGVVVAMDVSEAHSAIDAMLPDHKLSAQRKEQRASVVIEDFLTGEEASFIVLCDGKHILPLASSQDHKRLHDGDTGPNTGGMGAYSPTPVVTPNVHARVMHEIISPAIAGMTRDGIPYTGFLYAGVMIDPQGHVKTLEFNVRLGDPETQPLMMRLKSDLFDVLMHAADATLDKVELQWDRRVALGVVMAASGYPMSPHMGNLISGLPVDTDETMVFHAGTGLQNGQFVTAGGRVLCVTSLGDSVKTAQHLAYEALAGIHFDGAQFRHDIGSRASKR